MKKTIIALSLLLGSAQAFAAPPAPKAPAAKPTAAPAAAPQKVKVKIRVAVIRKNGELLNVVRRQFTASKVSGSIKRSYIESLESTPDGQDPGKHKEDYSDSISVDKDTPYEEFMEKKKKHLGKCRSEVQDLIKAKNLTVDETVLADINGAKPCSTLFNMKYSHYKQFIETKVAEKFGDDLSKDIQFQTDLSGEAVVELPVGTWYLNGSFSVSVGSSSSMILWNDVPFVVTPNTEKFELSNDNGTVIN